MKFTLKKEVTHNVEVTFTHAPALLGTNELPPEPPETEITQVKLGGVDITFALKQSGFDFDALVQDLEADVENGNLYEGGQDDE